MKILEKLDEAIKYANAGKTLTHIDSHLAIMLKEIKQDLIQLNEKTINNNCNTNN